MSGSNTPGVPPGYPCAALPAFPPAIADRQSDPSADDLLPQVLALVPRGAAWGTDEAGDGSGASPVMLQFWRAIAAWAADLNKRDFAVAAQCFPSAITTSLDDWEAELGLPDPCLVGDRDTEARIGAVRLRHAAQGDASPAYFVCLAASIGYDVTIEEPDLFLIDETELVEDSIVDGVLQPEAEGSAAVTDVEADIWKYWIVRVRALAETWFYVDEGELSGNSLVSGELQLEGSGDRLEDFTGAEDLECLLRRFSPQHTKLIFAYDG